MYANVVRFADIFCKLVKTRFYIAQQELFGKTINLYIWVFCSLVVMGYIMQSFGLASNYGCFQLATVIGTIGLFEVYGNALRSIVDFEGDRHVDYYLTLPARPTVILLSMISSYVLMGIVLSMLVLPFGALILFNSFNLADITWIKFAIILVLANIFCGTFTIAVTSHVGALSKMENIWSRFIFPMWFMGGFQFSWVSIYNLSQPLAYLLLCNPIMFIMEGMRAALLGPQDCLPWGLCCVVLCGFTVACWFYAHYKMKRLLDFV
jgi:ABC-type polysaccharide/polyol phosphate export permease